MRSNLFKRVFLVGIFVLMFHSNFVFAQGCPPGHVLLHTTDGNNYPYCQCTGTACAQSNSGNQNNTLSNSGNQQNVLNNSSAGSLDNPLKYDSITEVLLTILDVLVIFMIPIIILFIIYAGFLYVTARGNQSTIETAHRTLLYAVIGGLLILGARALLAVIQGTVNSLL